MIEKIRQENHKYHRKYYAKELHLERLQILKDFYREIFDDYEQMYTKAPKEQELYNLGILANESSEIKQESRNLTNSTTAFVDRLSNTQFINTIPFSSPKNNEIQPEQPLTIANLTSQQNLINNNITNNINTTTTTNNNNVITPNQTQNQNNQVNQANINSMGSKIINNATSSGQNNQVYQNQNTQVFQNQNNQQQQYSNQNNQQQQYQNNQQLQNQNGLGQNNNQVNSQQSNLNINDGNQISQNQSNNQSAQNQLSAQNNQLVQSNLQLLNDFNKSAQFLQLPQPQQNSIFSENIIDSPIKGDKREIKTNLINNNAVGTSNSTVFKRTDRFTNDNLITPPNIIRPPAQPTNNININNNNFNNVNNEMYDHFKRDLEQNHFYTPYKELEREFVYEEKSNNPPSLTITQSSILPRQNRKKIFQDQSIRQSNSQDRLIEQNRMENTYNQSQVDDEIYLEDNQDQELVSSSSQARQLQRNDTARSTLSQQKYRKNQLLQEINPSKLITKKNSLINQQGVIIQPQATNLITKNTEFESNFDTNQIGSSVPSSMWVFNPQGSKLTKIGKQVLNSDITVKELEKTEETREQQNYKANLNELARYKLREVILEEAKMNKQRKQEQMADINEQQKIRSLSTNNVRRSLLSTSPIKFTEDQQLSRPTYRQTSSRISQLQELPSNRSYNKENHTNLQARYNDTMNLQDQLMSGEQNNVGGKSQEVWNGSQQASPELPNMSNIANMDLLQKSKRNIFQPIEQQNFEKDRINSRFFKNEFRLKEQSNLTSSFLQNKKSRKQIFQPLDTKSSVDRFDKLNFQAQSMFQNDEDNDNNDRIGLSLQRDSSDPNSQFVGLSSPLKNSLNQLNSYQRQAAAPQNYLDLSSSRMAYENSSAFSGTGRISQSTYSQFNDNNNSQQQYNRPLTVHQRIQSSIQSNGMAQRNGIKRIAEDEQAEFNKSKQPTQQIKSREESYQNLIFDNNNRTISFQN